MTNNKKYVPIGMKNDSIITIMGPTVNENEFNNETRRVLINNNKSVQELIYSETDEGIKPDFVQLGGVIGFYCEKNTAKEIMALQKQYIKLLADERAKICSKKDYGKYRKKADDIIKDFFCKFRVIAKDSFLPFAYVDFYDIISNSGSFYGESDTLNYGEADLEPHCKGTIYLTEFLDKLEEFNYIEGVTPYDVSILNPIDYIEYCVKDLKGNTYFGYATPITAKGKVGKKAFTKRKKSN